MSNSAAAPRVASPTPSCARRFAATPDQVPQARHFLAAVLPASPATRDALICLSELVTNAIQHTRSARPGGHFTVRAARNDYCLRVEVEDDSGAWQPQPDHDGLRGRGLTIVAALARWGITGDGNGPRTVWFEVPQ